VREVIAVLLFLVFFCELFSNFV